MRNILIIFSVLVFAWACGGSSDNAESNAKGEEMGMQLFKTNCAICHGDDGRKGLSGAKMIPDSELSVAERIMLITQGKGNMMPYQGLLSEEEIKAVATYTTTLK